MDSKSPPRMSFSQREGKAPLPEQMRLEHLSDEFRRRVWLAVDSAINRESTFGFYFRDHTVMGSIASAIALDVLQQAHDKIDHGVSGHKKFFKQIVLKKDPHVVLSLVETILRQDFCPDQLRADLLQVFTAVPVAYSLETLNGIPTIVPRPSEESGAATQQAIGVVEKQGPEGAKAHLRKATQAIKQKRYADAVRESIHAVESVAKMIDPKAKKTLGPALKSLADAGVLKHPSLQQAFEKLYGYASDEKGIRHALLDEEEAAVDLDNAVFMFAACAAFSAYLVNRNEQMTKEEAG